jgi:hypothetical protein
MMQIKVMAMALIEHIQLSSMVTIQPRMDQFFVEPQLQLQLKNKI